MTEEQQAEYEQHKREEKRRDEAQAIVNALSNFVNSGGYDHQLIADAMMREHRTLQQQMFCVMLACIKMWSEQPRFDARNEYTCGKSREIMQLFPNGAWVSYI